MTWDAKKVIGIAVLVGALTQIGNGLKAASYLVGAPAAAYEGQSTSKATKDQFERYLERQDAVAEALTKYVTNQEQAPNAPLQPTSVQMMYREWDGEVCWQCPSEDRDWCWNADQWRRCD